MTPTRDHLVVGPQLDTGIGSPIAPRPNVWLPELSPAPASDSGVGSSPTRRPDTLGEGDAFIPPLWL